MCVNHVASDVPRLSTSGYLKHMITGAIISHSVVLCGRLKSNILNTKGKGTVTEDSRKYIKQV